MFLTHFQLCPLNCSHTGKDEEEIRRKSPEQLFNDKRASIFGDALNPVRCACSQNECFQRGGGKQGKTVALSTAERTFIWFPQLYKSTQALNSNVCVGSANNTHPKTVLTLSSDGTHFFESSRWKHKKKTLKGFRQI